MDWDHQIYFEDVHTNSIIKPISIPITLQRLVMEAGSNRDFSLMHHDNEVAKITGAPSAFANTFFFVHLVGIAFLFNMCATVSLNQPFFFAAS